MTDPSKMTYFTPEDAKRLREAAARLSTIVSEAWEAIIEAVTQLYRQAGMTCQEADDAINGAIEAATATDQANKHQQRNKPPRRPPKSLPAACQSIQRKPAAVARSHIYRRRNRKRGK